jgi:hypothetical protein
MNRVYQSDEKKVLFKLQWGGERERELKFSLAFLRLSHTLPPLTLPKSFISFLVFCESVFMISRRRSGIEAEREKIRRERKGARGVVP